MFWTLRFALNGPEHLLYQQPAYCLLFADLEFRVQGLDVTDS